MICPACGNRITVATEIATCLVCQHTGRQVAKEIAEEFTTEEMAGLLEATVKALDFTYEALEKTN